MERNTPRLIQYQVISNTYLDSLDQRMSLSSSNYGSSSLRVTNGSLMNISLNSLLACEFLDFRSYLII